MYETDQLVQLLDFLNLASIKEGRAADPHHFNADPDPTFYSNADLDPAFHFNVDPDPDPHQSDGTLRPSRTSF